MSTPEPHAALRVLRELGVAETDPVRWHFLETLARRASAEEGAPRRLLEARLTQWAAQTQRGLAARAAAPQPAPSPGPTARQALAALSERLVQARVQAMDTERPGPPPTMASIQRELQQTWVQLSARQRLTQSQASLPDNAGPLNVHHVMHQALNLMHDISPAYFEQFVSQVDALLWMASASASATGKAT